MKFRNLFNIINNHLFGEHENSVYCISHRKFYNKDDFNYSIDIGDHKNCKNGDHLICDIWSDICEFKNPSVILKIIKGFLE